MTTKNWIYKIDKFTENKIIICNTAYDSIEDIFKVNGIENVLKDIDNNKKLIEKLHFMIFDIYVYMSTLESLQESLKEFIELIKEQDND